MWRDRNQQWLSKDVFPLWLERGVDWERGGFVENLDLQAQPQNDPRRAMVLCRQLFAFRTGIDMGVVDRARATRAIVQGAESLLRDYSKANGAFSHAIQPDGRLQDGKSELYTQAFVLFGLAQAQQIAPDAKWKARALELVAYLDRERKVPGGGYTELSANGPVYRSNPHMHLFEAALAWREIDGDATWVRLSDEILELSLGRFIDAKTGLLAEYFDEKWMPIRENGRFFYEPGHQYEWAWLMGLHQRTSKRELTAVRRQLVAHSEKHGIDSTRQTAWDEVWSDDEPKSRSSRFWPQTERIKAICQQGAEGLIPKDEARATADLAMQALWKYLETPHAGLWFDTWGTDGKFTLPSVKASSLYHIIGAMVEYGKFSRG